MKTIEIVTEVKTKQRITIEVEFPFYWHNLEVFDTGGEYEEGARVEEDGRVYLIMRRDDRWELEVHEFSPDNYGGYLTRERHPWHDPKAKFASMCARFDKLYSSFAK